MWISFFRVDTSLCLPKLKLITVLLFDFSTTNENFQLSLFQPSTKGLFYKFYPLLSIYYYWLQWGRHKDSSTRKKWCFTEAARQRWISLLRVDKSLCLPKLKSITVLLYDFSFKNENFATFTFHVEDLFNLQSKTSKDFLTRFSNCY